MLLLLEEVSFDRPSEAVPQRASDAQHRAAMPHDDAVLLGHIQHSIADHLREAVDLEHPQLAPSQARPDLRAAVRWTCSFADQQGDLELERGRRLAVSTKAELILRPVEAKLAA